MLADEKICFISEKADENKNNEIRSKVCKDLPVRYEYNNNFYCVLHFPESNKHKTTNFDVILKERIHNQENDFRFICFSNRTNFDNHKFDSPARFSQAIFQMKRIISLSTALFFTVLIFSISCFGQKTKSAATPKPIPATSKCELGFKDAPVLRGLKLGMSEKEVLSFFEVDKKDLFEPLDVVNGSNLEVDKISPSAYRELDSFNDISKLNLGFYDEKLYQISLSYSFSYVEFDNAEQFAKTLSENFNLPFSAWKYGEPVTGVLGCKEFGLYIEAASNKITLTDLIAQKAIIDKNEQKRKNFKP